MFKVGDKVRCKPLEELSSSAGAGYTPGREFIVEKVTETILGKIVLWGESDKGGVYDTAVFLAPEALLQNVIYEINIELSSNESGKSFV